ncbi:MAG: hypothetical protein GY778_03625 [bacterium]|nr:hypothetical protein [bacterium]
MQFASAISRNADTSAAVRELLDTLRAKADPAEFDWLLLFCTAHYEDDLDAVVKVLAEAAPKAVLLGCSAEGTIGGDRESQSSCSLSVLGAKLPGVRVRPFHLTQDQTENADGAGDWAGLLGFDKNDPEEKGSLTVVFGDPFSFPILELLDRTNEVLPGKPLVGGMASAGEAPGQNRLIVRGEVYREGLVGVTLTGNFSAQTIVSQGCRPIGVPFVVTKGEGNVVHELGGLKPVVQLRKVLEGLSESEVALAKQALFLGRVINEYQETFSRGDFLIHNIIGMDRERGALAIAGPIRVGSTVQFHVPDAQCADEDLRSLLGNLHPPAGETPPLGALLFSCNGRGIRMWPEEGHDLGVLHELCGPIPTAGLFAAGEIGPVGGRNFIHGFTASIALLGPA